MESWQWVFESMKSLRVSRVISVAKATDFIGAITRPSAWPSYKWFSSNILALLNSISSWRLVFENRKKNLGAFLIVQSVTIEDRLQSYVATGYPSWLQI